MAEKFEAMVSLGIANNRMKDFYDLNTLGRDFRFDGPLLSEAVQKKRLLDKSDVRSSKEGLFHAYVGIGQISNVPKSMQMSRAYVLEKARAANDAEAVRKTRPTAFGQHG